jgi:hypothetical protein
MCLVENKTNTAKENMQALLDVGRQNYVEENAMITSVQPHVFFPPPD